MRTSAFKQVDVFTSEPMRGNALAVVLDADGLGDADMQRVAAWTNLSETTFVLAPSQPGASYRLRIFTPRNELPFAGHPSVGSGHALLEAGMIKPGTPIVQECAAGLLPVRVVGEGAARRVFVTAPPIRRLPNAAAAGTDAAVALGAKALADAPQFIDSGPHWLLCDLGDERSVRELKPDLAAIAALAHRIAGIGIAVFGRAPGSEYALAVRAFCPGAGIAEDPVTGSVAAALGFVLAQSGELKSIGSSFAISQGREIGRDGRIEVNVDTASGRVEIGGQSVTCVDGTLVLPGD